jgi:hypothetical protein
MTNRRAVIAALWCWPTCLLMSVVLPCTSFAMEIRREQTCAGVILRLRGDIRSGDYSRLNSYFKANEAIVGLDLSSGGGFFEEGLRIADLARRKKLIVYVSDECDSVCVDVFFAAAKRHFRTGSKIGVHSISNDRYVEDAESRLLTLKQARLWAKQGIPSSTICKMVTTRPDTISYLNRDDLSALGASAGNPFVSNADNSATLEKSPGRPGIPRCDSRNRQARIGGAASKLAEPVSSTDHSFSVQVDDGRG